MRIAMVDPKPNHWIGRNGSRSTTTAIPSRIRAASGNTHTAVWNTPMIDRGAARRSAWITTTSPTEASTSAKRLMLCSSRRSTTNPAEPPSSIPTSPDSVVAMSPSRTPMNTLCIASSPAIHTAVNASDSTSCFVFSKTISCVCSTNLGVRKSSCSGSASAIRCSAVAPTSSDSAACTAIAVEMTGSFGRGARLSTKFSVSKIRSWSQYVSTEIDTSTAAIRARVIATKTGIFPCRSFFSWRSSLIDLPR